MNNRKVDFFLFELLIIFSCIPYLFYGLKASSSEFFVVGSISENMNNISVSAVGQYFTLIKDVIAIVLFLRLLVRIEAKNLIAMLAVFLYGLIALFISFRLDIRYVVAGFRTFEYMLVTYLYLRKYGLSFIETKMIVRLVEVLLTIQFAIVIKQVIASGNIASFGSGAYRYSGAFAGSGNLGCFCLATLFVVAICYVKYDIISTLEIVAAMIEILFLSIASGTRQIIVLCIFFEGYIILRLCFKALNLDEKSSLPIYAIIGIFAGSSIVQWVVKRIGRGELMASGSGRFRVFNDFLKRPILEVVFGSGLGWGTNASINLGLTDTAISDSTINVVFAQFGIIGLLIFLFCCGLICYRMLLNHNCDFSISLMLIITFGVMLFFGNMFEQIAMSIIIVISYYLNLEGVDYVDASEREEFTTWGIPPQR